MNKEQAAINLQRAYQWLRDNPQPWEVIQNAAANDYANDRRISMQHYAEMVRAKDYSDINGNRTCINNTLLPAFARIMTTLHPEYMGHMEQRRSAFDEFTSGVNND